MHSSPPPFVLHTLPNSSSLTWSFYVIILGQKYKLWSSSLRSCLQSHVTPVISSLFGPNILLSNLFSNTLSPRSSLSVRDQVSHPYRTTAKIIVLHILIFMFLDGRRERRQKLLEWMVRALPEFNILLISSWLKFWFATVVRSQIHTTKFILFLPVLCTT
jgi:hypothetical protein